MKKTLLFASLLAVAVGLRAEDSNILYWQVLADNVAEDVGTYNTAYFYALSGDGGVERAAIGTAEWTSDQSAGARVNSDREGILDFSGIYGSGYNGFLVELAYWDEANQSSSVVGTSDSFSFAMLKSYLTTAFADEPTIPTQSVFAPSFYAVPEPTSGLLMLLGIAGLALRRKRA